MVKTSKDETIGEISRESLECIECVAREAQRALRNHRSGDARSFANVNTWIDFKQVSRIGEIGDAERAALQELVRQPVIARVAYIDEDGNEATVFVTRGSPRPVPGFENLASYRSDLGRIASLPVGDEVPLRLGGRDRYVTIQSSAKLHPRQEGSVWDSYDNELEIESLGKFTVVSLRTLLEPRIGPVDADVLQALLDEDEEPNVVEGIRRAVLSHMGLRDQPILDRHQDEIFRLPINTRCFLSGPPGTGKTTTLIRRLGQKIDLDALEPDELAFVQRAEQESAVSHRLSWMMFSPTELLRQYVKEAFAREGFAASDEHIRTWDEYRHEIARDQLNVLRTGTRRGRFVERPNEAYLNSESVTLRAHEWYSDFDEYLTEQLSAELGADAEWLSASQDEALSALGKALKVAIQRHGMDLRRSIAADVSTLVPEMRALLEQRRTDAERIVNLSLNQILHEDRGFLDALAQEIGRQAALLDYRPDEPEEDDTDSDIFEEEEPELFTGRSVSRKQARARYERAVRALARARGRRRDVSPKSQDGRLLAWLGERRVPAAPDLEALGRIIAEQSRLRKFSNLDNLIVRSVATKYRRFRTESMKQGRWYNAEPEKSSDICWKELDLVILAMLRTADGLLSEYTRIADLDLPDTGILGAIRSLYKVQILVDEATDFSVIQLACMYHLAHPALRSFFACGDINQRLTAWGIKSNEELDWVDPAIERRSITVSYRHTAKLVELAGCVAAIGESKEGDLVLPDRLDIQGVAPVWCTQLATDAAIAEWLASRIREIEEMVGKVPTVAVLVNDEAQVETLAAALNDRLQDMNLAAAACKDGKVVGNDRDVRVFNIRHIKGLEFEAVFFVDLDKTIRQKPDLFTQYLYVGATRAATYLGVTFRDDVPNEVNSLESLFEDAWLK